MRRLPVLLVLPVVAGLAACGGTAKPAARPAPTVTVTAASSTAPTGATETTAGLSAAPTAAATETPTFNPATDPSSTYTYPIEGSVRAGAHTYLDGVIVQVVSLVRVNVAHGIGEGGNGVPAADELIRVTVRITNHGEAATPLGQGVVAMTLLAGQDRYSTYQDPGFMGDNGTTSTNPEQVSVGSTVETFSSWDVPREKVDALAVTMSLPGETDAWTFTDAQLLLT